MLWENKNRSRKSEYIFMHSGTLVDGDYFFAIASAGIRFFHQPKTRGGVAERSGATRAMCFQARKFSIVRRARLVSAALACRRARKGPGMVGSVQLCGNFFCSCLGSSQRSPASSSPRSQQFSAGYTQQAAVPAFPEPCLGSSLLRTSSLEPGWEVRYFELV